MVQSLDDARRRPPESRGAGPGLGGRIPPHNLEAEESLLGSMMLSREAITAAVEAHIESGDFYKPAHGVVYEAALTLHARGEPIYPVTMAEERSRGLLARPRLGAAIPWSLESILQKCLMADPAKRYQQAAHLATDLRRFLEDQPLAYAPELSRIERRGRDGRKQREKRPTNAGARKRPTPGRRRHVAFPGAETPWRRGPGA